MSAWLPDPSQLRCPHCSSAFDVDWMTDVCGSCGGDLAQFRRYATHYFGACFTPFGIALLCGFIGGLAGLIWGGAGEGFRGEPSAAHSVAGAMLSGIIGSATGWTIGYAIALRTALRQRQRLETAVITTATALLALFAALVIASVVWPFCVAVGVLVGRWLAAQIPLQARRDAEAAWHDEQSAWPAQMLRWLDGDDDSRGSPQPGRRRPPALR